MGSDFGTILGLASGLSLAVERSMEVVKIGYLKIKKGIFPKLECTELSANEKIVLTIAVSIASIFIGGQSLVLQIPGVILLPMALQQVVTGLIISIGSGVLHTLYTMFIGIKNNIEAAQNGKT